jgi:hypothetical protein
MSSFNLEEVLDKSFLEKMKDINPDELLADLTKQLDGMILSQPKEVDKAEPLTVETHVPAHVDSVVDEEEEDKPLSRDEILRKIKARQQSMAKKKRPVVIQGRENPMQQQIKKMSEMLNGADAGEVNKMIDGMIGKMAQNSKEKKLMKKKIEKMMENTK